MKKSWVFLTLGILFISSAFAFIGHNGSDIALSLNGANTKLQTALDQGKFNSAYTGGASTEKLIYGHNSSEVYVNVGGSVETLAAALSDGKLENTLPGFSPSSSFSIIFGENANKIYITSKGANKTLQQAINDGDFIIASWNIGDWSACSVTACGQKGTQTRTVVCKTQSGTTLDDFFCKTTNPGSSQECKTAACSSCFPEGTLLTLGDGSKESIETVKIGETVLGYDVNKNELVNETVLELESPIREGYYILNLNDGSELKITNEHPVYIKNRNYEGWASIAPEETSKDSSLIVQGLEIGDKVFKSSGSWVEIIGMKYVNEKIQTYNLKRVSGGNTFFADGVLVHNKSGGIF